MAPFETPFSQFYIKSRCLHIGPLSPLKCGLILMCTIYIFIFYVEFDTKMTLKTTPTSSSHSPPAGTQCHKRLNCTSPHFQGSFLGFLICYIIGKCVGIYPGDLDRSKMRLDLYGEKHKDPCFSTYHYTLNIFYKNQ